MPLGCWLSVRVGFPAPQTDILRWARTEILTEVVLRQQLIAHDCCSSEPLLPARLLFHHSSPLSFSSTSLSCVLTSVHLSSYTCQNQRTTISGLYLQNKASTSSKQKRRFSVFFWQTAKRDIPVTNCCDLWTQLTINHIFNKQIDLSKIDFWPDRFHLGPAPNLDSGDRHYLYF